MILLPYLSLVQLIKVLYTTVPYYYPIFPMRGCRRRRLLLINLLICLTHSHPALDFDSHCNAWAQAGECENNPQFMKSQCASACARRPMDTLQEPPGECSRRATAGRCNEADTLRQCRSTCLNVYRTNLTEDTDGNCWYWATDGECESNAGWMARACARSCSILHNCTADPTSGACARSFECPLKADEEDIDKCISVASQGDCRAGSVWEGAWSTTRCHLSCALLDPPSVSKTMTRPKVRRSKLIDVPIRSRCLLGSQHERALLSAVCVNHPGSSRAIAWLRRH